MNSNPDMENIGPEIPNTAVSLYGQNDAMDDFPVLKAFQQYIDSEQAKSRKRLVVLCGFFSILMVIVVSVFVLLLINISSRNQALNDRLIDFAMKERSVQPSGSAVVVQPPADNSAILQLTEKLNEMQKRLTDSQTKAAQAEALVREANKPKTPTAEELEIKRLKALLSAEKEQRAVEKERLHQAEIEAYRRKHYPELYEEKKPVRSVNEASESQADEMPIRETRKQQKKGAKAEEEDVDAEIEAILNDADAISYYDEDDDEEDAPAVKRTKKQSTPPSSAKPSPSVKSPSPKSDSAKPAKKDYSIPVEIEGSSSKWDIPAE